MSNLSKWLFSPNVLIFFKYSMFYTNNNNDLQYFRKNYPEMTSQASEMLALIAFVVAIFNQPKKNMSW